MKLFDGRGIGSSWTNGISLVVNGTGVIAILEIQGVGRLTIFALDVVVVCRGISIFVEFGPLDVESRDWSIP